MPKADASAEWSSFSTRKPTSPVSATIRAEQRCDRRRQEIRARKGPAMSKSAMETIVQDREGERRPAIERLLNPRSVAIAGISATPGSLGAIVLDNLERFGFAGEIHLIHPTRGELRGIRCVAKTSDLPPGVDCVVLSIPAAGVREAVKGCAARGVGSVIVFSAGFAELGPQGRAVQDEIAAIARASNMAIEGPNCLGFVNHAA